MTGDNPFPGVHRSPRLPVDRVVADLAQRVWEKPTFSAKSENGMTQFIFSVPIQSGFRKESPSIHRILFEAKKTSWTNALEKAYPETRSGKTKLIKDFIDTLLYRLFYEALLILNTDTEGLAGDYATFKKEFTSNFRAASPRVPGKRPMLNRSQRSKYLANRYNTLLPRVRELRQLVNELKRSGTDDEQLLTKIGEVFKEEWMKFVISGIAFEKLPRSTGQTVLGIATTKWAPWRCTTGIICCEEEERDSSVRFGFVTAYKLIIEGRKLVGKLPSAPTQ
jgi:hypothetical protein